MALTEAFLRDNLLQTVMLQDVYVSFRKDFPSGNVNVVGGAGTFEDPYDAGVPTGGSNADSATKFDLVLEKIASDLSRPNPLIRLGPGEFYTRGASAWRPRSGMRILGAGKNETTLRLLPNVVSTGTTGFLIGTTEGESSHFLTSFELSDLTLHCGGADQPGGAATGGIALSGKNIFLHDLIIKEFGGYSPFPNSVPKVQGIWLRCHPSDPESGWNWVVERCLVNHPFSTANGTTIFIQFSSKKIMGQPERLHQACVIRDCFINGANASGSFDLAKDFKGLRASGGKGTIVEGNEVFNCRFGGPWQDAVADTSDQLGTDLVIRNNYYYNVTYGLYLNRGYASATNRIIATRNQIELAPYGADGEVPHGMDFLGGATGGNYGFEQLIVKNNTIRHTDGQAGAQATAGIRVVGCKEPTVQNNIINIYSSINAVRHVSCPRFTIFNNRDTTGRLLQGVDESNGNSLDQELENEIENYLLTL